MSDPSRAGSQNRAMALLGILRETLRAQLWPLPTLGILVAVVLGVFLPRLDEHVGDSFPASVRGVLFGGDAGAARTLLDSVSSSLITVTSLTFSLTVVTLQLASSQFSPRLLRTFTSDVFVQATLGLFLGTFTYSLTVLRSVRSPADSGGAQFVPRLSVTVGFVLALASVVGLVLFLAHLARQIRVETMLRDVHDDAAATAAAVVGPLTDAGPRPPEPVPPDTAVVLTAPSSGFLVRIDEKALFTAAVEADLVVHIDRYPGASLIEGTPIGSAWSASGPVSEQAHDALRAAISRAVHVGYERTSAQDIGYGLRQLTDVANKALSPGINDPTTAVHALGHISALLCDLAGRDLRPVLHGDDSGVRVVLQRPDLADLLDVSVTQPRRYGASDPQVLDRLFRLLGELAWHAPDEPAIAGQLARLRATVDGSDLDGTEKAQLAVAGRRVERTLHDRQVRPDPV